MMVLKSLLAGSFLMAFSLGFFQAAKKISCIHVFQVEAFSMLTGALHLERGWRLPDFVCRELLLIKKINGFVEVHNMARSRTLKLSMERNIVNESISL